jgi:hypothetical protein
MDRAWRIEYEGALYNILSRGNEQGDIFYDDTDRWRFLDTIGDLSGRLAIGSGYLCPCFDGQPSPAAKNEACESVQSHAMVWHHVHATV